jgi:hypothetical protein
LETRRPAEWARAPNRNRRRRVNIRLFAAHRPRALKEWLGCRKVTLGLEQGGEVVEDRCHLRMLGTEHLLQNRQPAFKERPCRRKVALGLEHEAEVVEAVVPPQGHPGR